MSDTKIKTCIDFNGGHKVYMNIPVTKNKILTLRIEKLDQIEEDLKKIDYIHIGGRIGQPDSFHIIGDNSIRHKWFRIDGWLGLKVDFYKDILEENITNLNLYVDDKEINPHSLWSKINMICDGRGILHMKDIVVETTEHTMSVIIHKEEIRM